MTRYLTAALAAAMLALGACSSTSFSCSDFRTGACSMQTTRFATDTQASIKVPGGGGIDVTSKPNDVATARAFDFGDRALGAVGAAIGLASGTPALVAKGARDILTTGGPLAGPTVPLDQATGSVAAPF